MCSFDIRVGVSDISLYLLAGHSKIRPTASLSPKNEPSCHYNSYPGCTYYKVQAHGRKGKEDS